jgi:hypothetical protein
MILVSTLKAFLFVPLAALLNLAMLGEVVWATLKMAARLFWHLFGHLLGSECDAAELGRIHLRSVHAAVSAYSARLSRLSSWCFDRLSKKKPNQSLQPTALLGRG